ncbi:4-hydroxythreonine-4-phosphate dehydrogenase [Geotalea uraniireducens]|uniref:4-hydroxythreonine-4-phosphate dehydrogenase n=1 Tax=Geotalea uraniireducens TaxID=351604 RepID=A0ABN6VR68_9BACT|nr:4-hydroxythreonine-4-phosphate dehydrogenase PdxA [Geotalea uraniireducens]BDV41246.1 4-hydroxythreonine-4-phosphate dehydrogenase [Geotalea uraniireducens]
MTMEKPLIALTMGDPTGIGPEIIAQTVAEPAVAAVCRPVVFGDNGAIARANSLVGAGREFATVSSVNEAASLTGPAVPLIPLTTLADVDMAYGQPTAASGDAMYRYIVEAARHCLTGEVDGMATAPINKEAMNRAGHSYPGHTELLAELTGSDEYVMMLAGERLRVALVTIHVSLRDVPSLLSIEKVVQTIRIVNRDVGRYFCCRPRIAVLALNPHCGEGGMFGDEEEKIIAPAVKLARLAGIEATGPLSADTLFHFAVQGEYDAVVCMYHDQGLIPLKLLHFDDAVNVTLGLPIIRTSVDHGTAYDLAGTGRASAKSMIAAVRMAAAMAVMRNTGVAV